MLSGPHYMEPQYIDSVTFLPPAAAAVHLDSCAQSDDSGWNPVGIQADCLVGQENTPNATIPTHEY